MKKLTALILIFTSLLISSCGSRDNAQDTTAVLDTTAALSSGEPEDSPAQWTEYNGYYFDEIADLDESSVVRFAQKLQSIYADNLSDAANVWYSIIPDREYYTSSLSDFDYGRMFEILSDEIADIGYIDITEALTLDCYYKTDLHWRQELLFGVTDVLGGVMGFDVDAAEFTEHVVEDYIGMYDGSSVVPETLCYLTSDAIDNAVADDFQYPDMTAVYNLDAISSDTPYDVFLHGATPLVTIRNDSADGGRLVIFRDSFSSSLAPLLIGEYSEITLVDIRYMVSSLLGDYVDFTDADVLFLYNVAVVNRSAMLR